MALCVRPEQRQDQERFDRCAAEFISLMSVKETEPKKTLCAQSTPGCSLMKGFFERASCPRRKTAHIHVRRPPGLQACGRAVGSLAAERRQQQATNNSRGCCCCLLWERLQPRALRDAGRNRRAPRRLGAGLASAS